MNLNRVLVLAIVLILLTIGGILLWYWQGSSSLDSGTDDSALKEEILNNASGLLYAGDYLATREEASRLVADADPIISIRAQRLVNEANFLIGTRESRLSAIIGAKSLYQRLEGYPEDQALVITSLLNYLSMAPESYVFEEIFTSGPFMPFWVQNNYIDSVKNLAEHSLTLKTTTTALARVGWWHADKILEISRSYNLSATEKKVAADEVLKIVALRQSLFDQEFNMSTANSDHVSKASFHFWQASLRQAAARVYSEQIEEAEKSLQALHDEYEASFTATGKHAAAITVFIPYAELYYAQALYEVKGESSLPDIAKHLSVLIATIEADPAVHRGSFIAMIERQSALAAQYRIFNHPTYARFIEQIPKFKAFLELYGWSSGSN